MALRIASFGVLGAALVAAVPACSSNDATPSPPSGSDSGATAPTWTEVYTTIIGVQNGCTICHTTNLASSFGSLDMSTQAIAYTNLVGVKAAGTQTSPSCASTNAVRVVKGDAANSLLYSKVSSATPLCGVRMPQGGPYLTTDQQAMIFAWIQGGAAND